MNWKILVGASGRLPRYVYWLSALGVYAAFFVLGMLYGGDAIPLWLFIAGLVLTAWAFLAVAACRSRDMGKGGGFALALLVPIFGYVVFFWLGFAKSEAADGRAEL